jgi:Ca-activated chloride channel homolog
VEACIKACEQNSIIVYDKGCFLYFGNFYRLLGDKLYRQNKFDQAENAYAQSNRKESSSKAQFNLGNAQIRQKKYEEATSNYDAAADNAANNKDRAAALYNKGNVAFEQKQYDKAVTSYKQSLKYEPNDRQVKENLIMAKRALRQQQNQQNNQDQQNKNKDQDQDKDQQKDDQQNNQDQNNQDKKEDPKKPNEDQKSNKNQDPKANDKKEQPSKSSLGKEQADRMMQMMDDHEKKVQQKLMRGEPSKSQSKKDW